MRLSISIKKNETHTHKQKYLCAICDKSPNHVYLQSPVMREFLFVWALREKIDYEWQTKSYLHIIYSQSQWMFDFCLYKSNCLDAILGIVKITEEDSLSISNRKKYVIWFFISFFLYEITKKKFRNNWAWSVGWCVCLCLREIDWYLDKFCWKYLYSWTTFEF